MLDRKMLADLAVTDPKPSSNSRKPPKPLCGRQATGRRIASASRYSKITPDEQIPDPASLLQEAQEQLAKAHSVDALEEVRITWLGRKEGRLTLLLKQLGTLSMDEKKQFGPS